ncbi:hypothetical protein [Corallococcus coralloides]|uniref:hypothetical protein n=1 Tax=Corallococcus coralloides TaxID=184914 RepID=UPI001430D0AA|nr:hypothetical protein [Corallococcus coralloides]
MSSTTAFLLDADSIIHLHSLGLIESLCSALQAKQIEAHCTRYVWEHELSTLQAVRARLTAAGLQVHTLQPQSPAGKAFKQLLKERGNPGRNSKGEHELIAFAQHEPVSITLVARDDGARKVASSYRISAIDIATFICELMALGALTESAAREATSCWDNPQAGNGRPKGYAGFDSLLTSWRSRRA